MRISTRGMNDFVPAHWTVPQNPIAGVGDLVRGKFAVPSLGVGDFAPTAAMYQFPENSILAGAKANGLAGCGGLGCGGGCGCAGLGATATTTTPAFSLTTIEAKVASALGISAQTAQYVVYGGIAAVALLIFKSMGK